MHDETMQIHMCPKQLFIFLRKIKNIFKKYIFDAIRSIYTHFIISKSFACHLHIYDFLKKEYKKIEEETKGEKKNISE